MKSQISLFSCEAWLKATLHLLHTVRVRDLAPLVEHIHAVVEFVAHARAVVESLDDVVELLFNLLVCTSSRNTFGMGIGDLRIIPNPRAAVSLSWLS